MLNSGKISSRYKKKKNEVFKYSSIAKPIKSRNSSKSSKELCVTTHNSYKPIASPKKLPKPLPLISPMIKSTLSSLHLKSGSKAFEASKKPPKASKKVKENSKF